MGREPVCVLLHGMLYDSYVKFMNETRKNKNQPPLTNNEALQLKINAVPLFWGDYVFIRPENVNLFYSDKIYFLQPGPIHKYITFGYSFLHTFHNTSVKGLLAMFKPVDLFHFKL